MSPSFAPLGTRLRGKTIFLSASVPSPRQEAYHRVTDAHFEIEQAVISLARAVFSESGRLVFGGHPAISPLIAMVAGEYLAPGLAAPKHELRPAPIQIYQSRAFEGSVPEESLAMYRAGYASIAWVNAEANERVDPALHYLEGSCPRSLYAMRVAMIHETAPDAMVCIGGMTGVEKELALFQKLRGGVPVYVFATTGGAAAVIARQQPGNVSVIDTAVMERIKQLRAKLLDGPKEHMPGRTESGAPLVPYPLIAQTIVDDIASHRSHAPDEGRH